MTIGRMLRRPLVVLDPAAAPANHLITLSYEPDGTDVLPTISVVPRPRGLP